MDEVRDTCLYIHTRKTDGLIFYVGIGNQWRPYEAGSARSEWWGRVAAKHGYDVHVLQEGLEWSVACELERMMISEFRSEAACGIARLVNLTDGGDGSKGWNKLPGAEERLANVSAGIRAAMARPEVRANVSAANRRKAADPEWQAKTTAANRRKAADPEVRANVTAANRRLAADPEVRANVTAANRRLAADPEWQDKTFTAVRAAMASVEGRGRNQVGIAHRTWDGTPFSSLNPQQYDWLYRWSDGRVYPVELKQLRGRGLIGWHGYQR